MSDKKKQQKQAKKPINRILNYFEGRPILGYAALTLGLMFLVFAMEQGTEFFRASLLQIPKFDGTTLPIKQSPNWTVTGGKNDLTFAQYTNATLIDLPKYEPKQLETRCDDPNDLSYQNACLTFTTVYMGNYHLDHQEFAGSHLAIDIRVPIGTPIYAVANGYVEIAEQRVTGFGKYIVIRHEAVPLVGGGTDTLYSSYAHLSEVLAKVDTVVKKGELIGYSGNSGISTTPHLHFQIDRSRAPFHPWWPFSSSEASKANMTFFDGINNGLGKEEARKNTVNPLEWVQKYLNYPAGEKNTSQATPTPTATKSAATVTPTKPPDESPQATEDAQFPNALRIDSPKTTLLAGESISLTLTALDKDGNIFASPMFDGELPLSLSGVGLIDPQSLRSRSFKNGVATVEFSAGATTGIAIISVDRYPETELKLEVVEKPGTVSVFEVQTDGRFTVGKQETITIKTIDEKNNVTPRSFPGTATISFEKGSGKLAKNKLTSKDFQDGIATVTFVPLTEDDIQIKVRSGVIIGESKRITFEDQQGALFSDVADDSPYHNAIAELKAKNILSGNPDGSFRPESSINRAEFAKVILLALDISPQSPQGKVFSDVAVNAWFASYAETAAGKGIVNGYPDGSFGPGKNINRAEVFAMLYRAANGKPQKNSGFNDVPQDAWYADAAKFAKQNQLLDFGSKFEPGRVMTRAEVAEAVSRFMNLL